MRKKFYKRKTKKRIIFLILLAILALTISFISIYNGVIKPFEGYDLTILTNYENTSDSILSQEYYTFYNEKVCYKDYEDKYDIDFFWRKGVDCILPQITLIFNHYTYESYSLIVKPMDDFNQVNEDNLNTLEFVPTPIGYDESLYFINYVQFDDWEFREIYNKTDDYMSEERYRESIRRTSYWYSFNKKTKEIVFSILFEESLDYYSSEEDLIKYFKKNLYH